MRRSFFIPALFRFIPVLVTIFLLNACSKDDSGGGNSSSATPFWKGVINSNVWEHGALLRSNGTARYFVSFSGGSMNDTANANVSKFEGTYNQPSGTDSIYINCSSATSTFKLKGVTNSAKTSMSGTWIYSAGGISNTLPYAMAK